MDGRIALLITKAEHHIMEQDYEAAEECISAAERIDPQNRSVEMLRELVDTLQRNNRRTPGLMRLVAKG